MMCVRNMSHGMAGFFGIPDADEDTSEQEKRWNDWKERSRRMHSGSMFLRGHKQSRDHTDAVSAVSEVSFLFLLMPCLSLPRILSISQHLLSGTYFLEQVLC